MFHLFKTRFFLAYSLLLGLSTAHAAQYHMFGARLSLKAMPYAGYGYTQANNAASIALAGPNINPLLNIEEYLSLGLGIPIGLDFTFSPTQALELYIGTLYTPSVLLKGRDPYLLMAGVHLGYRYYINPNEPIQAFFGQEVGFGFPVLAADLQSSIGMRFPLHEHLSLDIQNGLGISFASHDSETLVQAHLSLGAGLHVHF